MASGEKYWVEFLAYFLTYFRIYIWVPLVFSRQIPVHWQQWQMEGAGLILQGLEMQRLVGAMGDTLGFLLGSLPRQGTGNINRGILGWCFSALIPEAMGSIVHFLCSLDITKLPKHHNTGDAGTRDRSCCIRLCSKPVVPTKPIYIL